ncbi:hypothetical protein O181_011047 [Austropuccinia psidii MF-1]|uniref:Uncharacterized protein n=1 Tax=Austropuccinia psidii MF-1 TaxID=1389203 RepID=A0A9Q3BUY9_9BASI|nr:hypothetical protein [Austropuccinia psidii MF-1]
MTLIYKEGKIHTNSDGLRRWLLYNDKRNPAYDPEVSAKIPVQFMEIDLRMNVRFSEWEPEFGTSDIDKIEPKGTETPILGIGSSELHKEFFSSVTKPYAKHKQFSILHSTTGESPSLVGKGWDPLLPVDHLNKNLLPIHPTPKDFYDMWKKACDSASKCIAEEKE